MMIIIIIIMIDINGLDVLIYEFQRLLRKAIFKKIIATSLVELKWLI